MGKRFQALKTFFRAVVLNCIMIPFNLWNETGAKSSLDTFKYAKCFTEWFYAWTRICRIWTVIRSCLNNLSINYMKVRFYVRNVTLQLKGNPKVQWGTESIPLCYFQKAFDQQILIKPFLTLPKCLFYLFFSANKATSGVKRFKQKKLKKRS